MRGPHRLRRNKSPHSRRRWRIGGEDTAEIRFSNGVDFESVVTIQNDKYEGMFLAHSRQDLVKDACYPLYVIIYSNALFHEKNVALENKS